MVVRLLPLGTNDGIPRPISEHYFPNRAVGRVGVGDDGSCFFHSIAHLLNECNYRCADGQKKIKIGRSFRQRLCRALTPEGWRGFWNRMDVPADQVPTVAEIRRRMKRREQWADIYMISWVMDYLNICLYFFDTTTQKVYCGVRQGEHPKVGFILWLNHSHFEPMYEAMDGNDRYVFSKDDPTALGVERQYAKDGCGVYTIRHMI